MTEGTNETRPHVSQAAMLLGFAGLAPQFAAVTMIALGRADLALPVAVAYPLIILSFLGGIWWGFAVRRRAGQAALAALAVVPSLVAMALLAMATITARMDLLLFGAGVALIMTIAVDRHLERTGDAPADWMRLRVPLSLGLGGLTIVAGFMTP